MLAARLPIGRPALARALSARPELDFLVVGAGSGGMAASRRAAAHGAKVAVVEQARLGGTCVNVGCVPKKIMFIGASMGHVLHRDAAFYGHRIGGDLEFDWRALKDRRDAYVRRLNGIYERCGLRCWLAMNWLCGEELTRPTGTLPTRTWSSSRARPLSTSTDASRSTDKSCGPRTCSSPSAASR